MSRRSHAKLEQTSGRAQAGGLVPEHLAALLGIESARVDYGRQRGQFSAASCNSTRSVSRLAPSHWKPARVASSASRPSSVDAAELLVDDVDAVTRTILQRRSDDSARPGSKAAPIYRERPRYKRDRPVDAVTRRRALSQFSAPRALEGDIAVQSCHGRRTGELHRVPSRHRRSRPGDGATPPPASAFTDQSRSPASRAGWQRP